MCESILQDSDKSDDDKKSYLAEVIKEVSVISGRSSKTPTETLTCGQNRTITDVDETKDDRQAAAFNQTANNQTSAGRKDDVETAQRMVLMVQVI